MARPRLRTALLASAIAAAAVGPPGCSFNKLDINDPGLPEKATAVLPGKTTAKELPGILGSQPIHFIQLEDGSRLLVYTYGQSKSSSLSLGVVSFSKTNTGLDTAFFLADPGGVIREMWVGANSRDLPWQWWAFGD